MSREADAPVIFERSGPIARIRFNRPERLNAIDIATAAAFLAACRAIAEDRDLRVVVISGEGRAFMAGGDLGQFQRDAQVVPDQMIQPMHEGLMLLMQAELPVVASVHGVVAGAGLSLTAACDLGIAADDARFTMAYSGVGVSSDLGGSWSLPRLIGLRRALHMALLNDSLDATQALNIGLVNSVVPLASLRAETDKLAARLAAAPPLALGAMKRLMRQSSERSLAAQLDEERESFRRCIQSPDFAEALSAFFEKRAGVYDGQRGGA